MSGIIKSVVGLFTLGRSDFADISMFRDELSFRLALELERVPSEETLRQRLDNREAQFPADAVGLRHA